MSNYLIVAQLCKNGSQDGPLRSDASGLPLMRESIHGKVKELFGFGYFPEVDQIYLLLLPLVYYPHPLSVFKGGVESDGINLFYPAPK